MAGSQPRAGSQASVAWEARAGSEATVELPAVGAGRPGADAGMPMEAADAGTPVAFDTGGGQHGSGGGTVVRACAAIAAISLLMAIAGRLAGVEALALIGGYGVVFLGLGAAPFQPRAKLDPYARMTGTVLVGFSVLLLTGAVMADLRGLWNPALAAVALGVPALVLHAVGLYRVWRIPPGTGGPVAGPDPVTSELQPPAPGRTGLRSGELVAALRWTPERTGLQLTLVGTVFWLATAIWTRNPNPGYWGMLATINPLWYVGLVIVLAGFAVGRRSELSAGLAALSFGLATTLTPALVYGAPREQTAAKQMQIVQYVLDHHHIHVTAGIYQAFSSLFSGVAALSQLLGVHGMLGHMSLWSVATYWPVLLMPMRIAVLAFLFGRLLPTTSRRWCAVMLVLLVDSLGTDYFSPQAVGFVMSIGVVAVAMNGRSQRPFSKGATTVLLLLSGIAMAPAHELSPYMAAGALIVLALFAQAPRWSWAPIAVPALLWAALVHRAISRNFSFSSLFNISNFQPPITVATPGLHRLPIVATQSHVLLLALLILIGLGAIGFLAHVRERWAWAYALCPIVGIALIAINPYGNEGIFRATLFAIPWMAVLAMRMPHPFRWVPESARPIVVAAALTSGLTVLLATFVVAAYAMDGTNVLPRDNVAVVDFLTRQAPRDAFVLAVGSANNPADGANFTFRYHTLEWTQVAQGVPALRRATPTGAGLASLRDHYRLVARAHGATPRSPLYLIWDRSSLLYTNAYGLQSSAEMRTWLHLLRISPSWRLVDRDGSAYLFRLT